MKKHVVIVGGGFAGMNVARQLANHPHLDITLVDKNNYNFFPPLLYQVATGFLEISSISYPFRKMFASTRNLKFWMGELQSIAWEKNTINLNNGSLSYDYLVLATGTTTNFFGMKNVQLHAIPMKTLEEALNMRNLFLRVATVGRFFYPLQHQIAHI